MKTRRTKSNKRKRDEEKDEISRNLKRKIKDDNDEDEEEEEAEATLKKREKEIQRKKQKLNETVRKISRLEKQIQTLKTQLQNMDDQIFRVFDENNLNSFVYWKSTPLTKELEEKCRKVFPTSRYEYVCLTLFQDEQKGGLEIQSDNLIQARELTEMSIRRYPLSLLFTKSSMIFEEPNNTPFSFSSCFQPSPSLSKSIPPQRSEGLLALLDDS
jgi:septal ring factor EnvC (AmiA/AmiB activator)